MWNISNCATNFTQNPDPVPLKKSKKTLDPDVAGKTL